MLPLVAQHTVATAQGGVKKMYCRYFATFLVFIVCRFYFFVSCVYIYFLVLAVVRVVVKSSMFVYMNVTCGTFNILF